MIITYPLNGITYTAEDAESYLCTRTSGVFSSDNHFALSITGDREVTISPGLAWIKNDDYAGKSVLNTQSVALAVPVSDGALDRIDRIVLRFDKSQNRSDLMLLTGNLASSPIAPAITRTSLIYDLALYDIRVPAASVSVTVGNITSNILDETLCGIMRDGVTQIPTSLLQQQVNELMVVLQDQADELIEYLREEIENVKEGSAWLLTPGEARAEARAFYEAMKGFDPLFYVLDAESDGLDAALIGVWAEEMRKLGAKKLGCYVAHNHYDDYEYDTVRGEFDFTWIPRYGSNDGTVEGSKKPAYACDLWQYTSKGTLPGIKGNVDLNLIAGEKGVDWFRSRSKEE